VPSRHRAAPARASAVCSSVCSGPKASVLLFPARAIRVGVDEPRVGPHSLFATAPCPSNTCLQNCPIVSPLQPWLPGSRNPCFPIIPDPPRGGLGGQHRGPRGLANFRGCGPGGTTQPCCQVWRANDPYSENVLAEFRKRNQDPRRHQEQHSRNFHSTRPGGSWTPWCYWRQRPWRPSRGQRAGLRAS